MYVQIESKDSGYVCGSYGTSLSSECMLIAECHNSPKRSQGSLTSAHIKRLAFSCVDKTDSASSSQDIDSNTSISSFYKTRLTIAYQLAGQLILPVLGGTNISEVLGSRQKS